MKKMTIRSKLTLTTTLSIGLVSAIVVIFLITRRLEENIREKLAKTVERVTLLKETTTAIENQFARVDFYLVTQDSREIDEYESLGRANLKKLEALGEFPWRGNFDELNHHAASLLRSSIQNPAAPIAPVALDVYLRQASNLRSLMQKYLTEENERLELLQKEAEIRLKKLGSTLLALSLGGILIVVILNALTSRSIIKPLALLQKGVGELGRNPAPQPVNLNGNDELGKLGKAFNEMIVRLRELDQMKQDFTASVTHELRSPLSAGQSFVNVILDDLDKLESGSKLKGEDIKRWKTFLTRLSDNMSVLHRFVSDLLEIAKIERGKLECHPKETPLKSLLEETIEFFKPRAKQKDILLDAKIDPDLPNCLIDLERIRQVLVNLLDNALKFTPRSGLIYMEAIAQDPQFVRISVKDTGAGIPKEHLNTVFEKFTQIREAYRHAEGVHGTGLGLPIAKAIVEMHGGKIWVESKVDKGSTFFFTLKQAPVVFPSPLRGEGRVRENKDG